MPVFDYKAINKQGKEQSGSLEADSAKSARNKLKEQQLIPLEVTEVQDRSIKKTDKSWRNLSRNKLSIAELSLVTRQMATLLASGLPVDETLQAVSEQTDNDKVTRIIKGVRSKVLEGHSLSASMGEFKEAFSDLYCATISAGEHSGYLHMVLQNLADYTEKQHQFNKKLQQAAVFPALMITVSLIIVSFLLVYIVPKMAEVFQDSGQPLPFLTVALLNISNFLQSHGILLISGIVIAIFCIKKLLQNRTNKYKFHLFLLRMPMISKIIKVSNTARYARTFGILSKAGVPVLESMDTANYVVTNLPMQKALNEARQKVKEGVNISRALKESKYFPPMSIHLIASGESSGKLETMLDKAATYQEQEIESLIATFLSLFEPVMIILLGLIVLVIVLAILLPIFQMNQFIAK